MNKADRLRDDVQRLQEELRLAQQRLSLYRLVSVVDEQPQAEKLTLADLPAAFDELLDQGDKIPWNPEGFQQIWHMFESVCLRAGLTSIVRNGAGDEIPSQQIGSAGGPDGRAYLEHTMERVVYVTARPT